MLHSTGSSATGSPTEFTIETSIVIPAYNEAARIRQTLETIHSAFATREEPWELVVVDDGSTDETRRIVREFAGHFPQVRLFALCKNHGKGGALRVGMTHARGRRILMTDADLSTPIEEFDRLSRHLVDCDLVIGDRKTDPTRIGRRQPRLRETLGRYYTLFTNLILGLTTPDFTCGFKCFTRSAAHQLFDKLRIDGWSYDAELLFLAYRSGMRVKSVPVRWANHPDTRVRLLQEIGISFYSLLAIRTLDWFGGYRTPRPLPEFAEIQCVPNDSASEPHPDDRA